MTRHTIFFLLGCLLGSSAWADTTLGPLLETRLASAKSGTPVQVAIRTDGRPVAGIKRVQARAGHWLQAVLEPEQIRRLAKQPGVLHIRLPWPARSKGIVSEGLAPVFADALHAQGITGKGVRIAVLDVGFADYARHLGRELPARVGVKNFNSINFETTVHGRAVAEIVHDVAPDAELTLIAVGTEVEYLQALEWIKAQQPPFHIVTASLGFDNIGPLDGRSEITRAADSLFDAGILYFNAAGNEQQQYWNGRFNDPDGNGWHNFSGEDERFRVELNKLEPFEIVLNWDDWGDDPANPQASQDYDLYLWCPDTEPLTEATACQVSRGVQDGGEMRIPLERLEEPSPKGGYYYVGIKRRGGSDDRLMRLSFVNDAGIFGLEYRTPESTLTHPADGQRVIAVGAWHYSDPERDLNPDRRADDPVWSYSDWSHDLPPEPFSSMGPTWDGRHKPDLTGPDGVSTEAYGAQAFFGTSAATPHAAGAAALLMQQRPERNLQSLRHLLLGMSTDVEPLGMDDAHGAGRLSLAPVVANPWISSYTGIWHEPNQNGHGFSVLRTGNRMALLWYFYDRDGEPIWLLAASDVVDETLDASLHHFTGPALGVQGIPSQLFDSLGSTVEASPVGNIRFRFLTDAPRAEVHIDLDGSGPTAALSADLTVEPLLHAPAATNDNTPYITEFTGLWHNPAQNGHGFFVSKQGRIRSPDHFFWPTDDTAIFWYSYDPDSGTGRWWLASGATGVADEYAMAGDGLGEYPLRRFFMDQTIADDSTLERLFGPGMPPVRNAWSGGLEFSGLRSGELNGYYHFAPFHVELPLEGMRPYRLTE